MQRTPHCCPHCRQPIWIHSDMWGPYYLCEDCGWTAEDDEHLTPAALKPESTPPFAVAAEREAHSHGRSGAAA